VKRFANARSDTKVHRADDCWSGVVSGALLGGMGIGVEMPTKLRSCPRHYGICVHQQYRDWLHTGANPVRDTLDGQLKVHSQLLWLMKQGDLIPLGKPLISDYECQYQITQQQFEAGKTLHLTFVSTTAIDAPSALSELSNGMDNFLFKAHRQSVVFSIVVLQGQLSSDHLLQ
jgi:hypothetical protein